MIADQDAVRLVRRAILEHIRDLVEDLSHWANELDRLEAPGDPSDLLESLFSSQDDSRDPAEREADERAIPGGFHHTEARQSD